MHPRRYIALAVALAAAALAAPASASPASASSAVVEHVSRTGSVLVPPGAFRSITLSCPKGAVALGGAATSMLPARDSVPGTGARRWTFRFTSGGGVRGAAILRCVRLRLPPGARGGNLVVATVREPDVRVAGRSVERFDLRCPRGQLPTGWGLERGAGNRALQVLAAVPTRRGWAFRLENTRGGTARGTLRIRCLQRTQHAQTGEQHSFATRVASFDQPGDNQRHACRRSEYSVSAGFSLDPVGDGVARRAYPTSTRAGRWSFGGASDAPPVTSLVCLSLRTPFD